MKEDRIYLLHVRDALERICSYTAEGKQAFLVDPRTQDAVVRNLRVVGEAGDGVERMAMSDRQRWATLPAAVGLWPLVAPWFPLAVMP